jgi:chemotaxis response regulator CheB
LLIQKQIASVLEEYVKRRVYAIGARMDREAIDLFLKFRPDVVLLDVMCRKWTDLKFAVRSAKDRIPGYHDHGERRRL